MTKPAITKYSVKGSPLTTSELDTNFQNLIDATVSITAGSGGTQVTSDLNGNITLVAGSGISLSGNNTSKEITITNTSLGSNSFTTIAVSGQSDVVADTTSDTLTLVAGSGVSITTDASTDTITITNSSPATGTINSGTTNNLAFYSSSTTIDDATVLSLTNPTGASTPDLKFSGPAYFSVPSGSEMQIRGGTSQSTKINIALGSLELLAGSTSSTNAAKVDVGGSGGKITLKPLTSGGLNAEIALNGPSVFYNVTTTQRNSLSASAGMVVFNTTDLKLQVYNGSAWVDLH